MSRAPAEAPRPWVRLWRDERGSFAQLPLFARALAAELLKLCDEDGRIPIGNRPPADAIAFALGADRSDRRLLKKFVPLLEADGYIKCEEGTIVVVAWHRWQAPPKTRPDPDGATTEPRRSNDRTTKRPRSDHEDRAKCPESHARKPQEGEGEGEGEGEEESRQATDERSEGPREPARPPVESSSDLPDAGPDAQLGADTPSVLRRAWSAAWLRQTERTNPTQASDADLDAVAKLAPWFEKCARLSPDASPAELIEHCIPSFFAEKTRGRPDSRPRPEWLAEDPGRYLRGFVSRQRRREEREKREQLDAEHRQAQEAQAALTRERVAILRAGGTLAGLSEPVIDIYRRMAEQQEASESLDVEPEHQAVEVRPRGTVRDADDDAEHGHPLEHAKPRGAA